MKTPAFILLFSFAAFLTETGYFPMEMYENCMKPTSAKTCCTKTKCGMKQSKCTGKKENKKPSGKCKDNAECTFCPICSVFTFQAQYELSLKYSFLIKKYQLINSDDLTAYLPPVWKPPNADFFLKTT